MPERATVQVDTLVELGGGRAVLIADGDAVPAEYAGKPTRPRDGAPGKRAGH